MTQAQKAERLRALHRGREPLLLINAWDAVSARIVEQLGYPAVASTSAGVAWTQGFADGQHISREHMLQCVKTIAHAVSVPVSADLEAAYGETVEDASSTARGAIEAGAVGLNIEDGQEGRGSLVPLERATARIAVMRHTAALLGVELVINARTDGFLAEIGSDDAWRLEESVRRGNAFLAAGADSVFVPGVADEATIAALVARINGPLNVLATSRTPPLSRLKSLGVARVSLGSGAAGYVLAKFREAAEHLRQGSGFAFLAERISHADTNALFQP
jgi:2-methylisocitrate lyase-like PEP mutase family enzyme